MSLLSFLRSRQRIQREVHATAQLDLRDGPLEAAADRIAELEALNARLLAELATYKTRDFMEHALRLRRRQAEQHTTEPVRPAQHRREAQTEIHPRAALRRESNRGGRA